MKQLLTYSVIFMAAFALLSCGGTSSSRAPAPVAQSVPVLALPNVDQPLRVGTPINYDTSQGGRTVTDADRDFLTYSISFEPDSLGLIASGRFVTGTAALEGTVTAIVSVRDTDGNTLEDRFEITIVNPSPQQVFITQDTDIINVFVKGSTEASQKYLRYQFKQHDTPSVRAEGWGWRLLDEAEKLPNDRFIIGTRLMRGGENFVAVREVGKTDFMGGINHGDQVDSDFVMLIDGEEKAVDGRTSYIGNAVEFRQTGTLNEADNPVIVPTASIATNFQITQEMSVLSNRLELLRPVELSSALLTMLSADRHVGGDTDAQLLTDTAAWSPDFIAYNVSEEKHSAPRTTADELQLSGPSGFNYSVKMTAGWDDPNRRSFVAGAAAYNKLYFSPIGFYESSGPGLQLPEGHVIEVAAEYRLDTAN